MKQQKNVNKVERIFFTFFMNIERWEKLPLVMCCSMSVRVRRCYLHRKKQAARDLNFSFVLTLFIIYLSWIISKRKHKNENQFSNFKEIIIKVRAVMSVFLQKKLHHPNHERDITSSLWTLTTNNNRKITTINY